MARFSRAVTNRLTNSLRRSPAGPSRDRGAPAARSGGRVHRTPVNVFVARTATIFALTYGRDAQWVRNVLAAGGYSCA